VARRPRQVVAGRCYHLAQSGHGDASFCLDAEDRSAYEQIFFEAALGLGLFVHGWAVVGREAHWLVTPQRSRAMADVVQQVGRRYVRRFNARWRRTGTPWAGRYRSYWVDPASHGVDALVWMAWQSVRAGLCGDPLDWPWSSAALLAGQQPPARFVNIKSVEGYWALGNTPFEREAAFMRLLREPLSPKVLDGVARGLSMGWPLLGREAWARLPAEERDAWVVRPRGRPAGQVPLSSSLVDFDMSPI